MKSLWVLFVAFGALFGLSTQQQCSSTQLCEAGCCSSAGFCGYGPDYCGKGCQSTCDRKADCNPGWDGSDWSKWDKCPLNVCCSPHGFCGFTKEFCKGNEVKRPSCSVGDSPVTRVIGYYEGWASSKRSCLGLVPEEIPYGHYTHIVFSFLTVNPETFEVTAGDQDTELMLSRMEAIRILQPDIKLWVAIGGWAFNDPGPTQTVFSDVAASPQKTNKFIRSLQAIMMHYGFDGVDIDWEYPVAPDRHGRGEDYKNIVKFMRTLKLRMFFHLKGVSMALPASYWYLQHFDIKALERHVDWFNIMTYDIHGAWDIDNKWTGPWANSHTNLTEIQSGLDLLWRNDISPKKVTIGMSYYSRSFTLADPSCNGVGCRVSSAGAAGRCSGTAGVLLHPEIQEVVSEKGLAPVLHRDAAVKTVSWDNQWVSFDDAVTWRLKANHLRSQCIEGFMVWAISQDDKKGTNAKALGRPVRDFPNLEGETQKPETQISVPQTCRWSSCFEGCPSGFKEMPRDGHKEFMLDTTHCKDFGMKMSRLCCPISSSMPVCQWRGHRHSGKCKGACNQDEVEVGTIWAGCKSGHQSACCTRTESTTGYKKCMWMPCSKNAGKDMCLGTFKNFITTSSIASGGWQSCRKNEKSTLCCQSPSPGEMSGTCGWVQKTGHSNKFEQHLICEGSCRDDQFRVGLESGDKAPDHGKEKCKGEMAYCCDKPSPKVPRYDGDTGSAQAREFNSLMASYMANPTCPSTILFPPLTDSQPEARSLKAESIEYEILRGRAQDCTLSNWSRLLNYAMLLFTTKQTAMSPLIKIWDNDFAGYYDKIMEQKSLADYFEKSPNEDIRVTIEYVLYNPLEAGDGIRNSIAFKNDLCTESPMSNRRRDIEEGIKIIQDGELVPMDDKHEVNRRIINAWGKISNKTKKQPKLQAIIQAIRGQILPLEYARWQWYNANRGIYNPGPFLELAYRIGPRIGVNGGQAFDQYRDMSPARTRSGVNQFIIFHMHIDPSARWLQRNQGTTFLGITSLTMYHSNSARSSSFRDGSGERIDTSWRATNMEQGVTIRSGLRCAVFPNNNRARLWWVGSQSPASSEPQNQWLDDLRLWGQDLHQQGYTSRPALNLILNRPNPSVELGEEDNERLVPNNAINPSLEVEPYRWNFRIEDGRIVFDRNLKPPRTKDEL
ncbi:hypothetical protein MY10362_000908 [Beauveria mimosiformis]